MPKPPNYNQERQQRDRIKANKKAEKLAAKTAAKTQSEKNDDEKSAGAED